MNNTDFTPADYTPAAFLLSTLDLGTMNAYHTSSTPDVSILRKSAEHEGGRELTADERELFLSATDKDHAAALAIREDVDTIAERVRKTD